MSALAVAVLAGAASAQLSDQLTMTRIGLVDATHTGSGGEHQSQYSGRVSEVGYVFGRTTRYNAAGATNGQDAWVWTPTLGTVQIGLWGAGYTDSGGGQTSYVGGANSSGMIVGTSDGLAYSNPWGTLSRVASWYWTPETGTVQLSYGPNLYSTRVVAPTDAGQIAGYTYHAIGANVYHSDAWVWTQAGGYHRVGLVSQDYTMSAGGRQSFAYWQNQSGQAAGTSALVIDDEFSGQDAWVYRSSEGTVRVNPTDAGFTGVGGYRNASILEQNESGFVAGTSVLVRNIMSNNGQATWVWSPAGGTQRIGLFSMEHTGLNGRQNSEFTENNDGTFLNAAGYASGVSTRYNATGGTIGSSAWIFAPGTGTVQVGLTDALHTSSTGVQESSVRSSGVNLSGQAIGQSTRYTGGSGQDAWVRTPSGEMHAIGFTGAGFTGSAGYQSSVPLGQTESGVVVGQSNRVSGVSSPNGVSSWAWTSATGTIPIGLRGPVYTGSDGYQNVALFASSRPFVGEQVIGESHRILGVSTVTGVNTWAWSAATGTVQTGLVDALHTSFSGIQSSTNITRNASGVVGGYSARFSGGGAQTGSDAWYFDPATQVSHQATLGVPDAVRLSDGYSSSQPTSITAEGVMVGTYLYFSDGQGGGQQHPFLYRPDLGFADVNDLIAGGITGSGWASILSFAPFGGETQVVFVGSGQVLGQTSGTSLFVLTVPAPGTAVFAAAGLALVRRRRR
ncbi:MAG: hypothetical protein QM783_04885 [Phycisphaerales bacterium]